MSPKWKKLLGALAIGIVGALLSSRLIEPALDALIALVMQLPPALSRWLYAGAARGAVSSTSSLVSLTAILIVLILYLVETTPPAPRPSHRIAVLAVAMLFVSQLCGLTVLYTLSEQLYLRFNQQLRIVAPYVSEDEEERLAAAWASMGQRADYEAIVARFAEIAQETGAPLREWD